MTLAGWRCLLITTAACDKPSSARRGNPGPSFPSFGARLRMPSLSHRCEPRVELRDQVVEGPRDAGTVRDGASACRA